MHGVVDSVHEGNADGLANAAFRRRRLLASTSGVSAAERRKGRRRRRRSEEAAMATEGAASLEVESVCCFVFFWFAEGERL